MQNAIGVLGFDFSLYRIFPTGPAPTTPRRTRDRRRPSRRRHRQRGRDEHAQLLPHPRHDDANDDDPATTCAAATPTSIAAARTPTSRWSSTRQRDKLLQALRGLDADVLGLNELENTPGVDPWATDDGIVAGLNDCSGRHLRLHRHRHDRHGRDQGRPDLQARRGHAGRRLRDPRPRAVDPRFIDTKSRPSLAQTFEVNATGAAVHGRRQPPQVEGLRRATTSATRTPATVRATAAARARWRPQALVDWLADRSDRQRRPRLPDHRRPQLVRQGRSRSTRSRQGADDVAGTADDYTNLIAQFNGTYAYSYIFDGRPATSTTRSPTRRSRAR